MKFAKKLLAHHFESRGMLRPQMHYLYEISAKLLKSRLADIHSVRYRKDLGETEPLERS